MPALHLLFWELMADGITMVRVCGEGRGHFLNTGWGPPQWSENLLPFKAIPFKCSTATPSCYHTWLHFQHLNPLGDTFKPHLHHGNRARGKIKNPILYFAFVCWWHFSHAERPSGHTDMEPSHMNQPERFENHKTPDLYHSPTTHVKEWGTRNSTLVLHRIAPLLQASPCAW